MSEAPSSSKTLYLIDGHAQIFRAYFAIRSGLTSPTTGEPTHAVFAFAGMLLKLFQQFRPHYVAMPIDVKGKTFRDELYPEYKATREKIPDDFASQEQRIFDLTRLFGIPIIGIPGAEADDVIATLVHRVCSDPQYSDLNIRMVSKDKDLEQLLCDRVTMFDIHTDTTIDEKFLLENKSITPAQVVDVLALTGDTVDNVPGVPGVGPKTAAKLINQFGSIDAILANLDQLKGKLKENLEKSRDALALSRQLVTLNREVPLQLNLADMQAKTPDFPGIRRMFQELGFRRHQTDLDKLMQQMTGASETATATTQGAEVSQEAGFADSLFSHLAGEKPAAAPAAVAGFGGGEEVRDEGLTVATDFNYKAIRTHQELENLARTLSQQQLIALDTETGNLDHDAVLCGISLSWDEGAGVYVPMCSPEQTEHLDQASVLAVLKPLLEDPNLPKTGHNIKYDLLVLHQAGVHVRGVIFDSMIASFLLNLPGHGLDALSRSLLKHRTIAISQLIGEPSLRGTGLKQRTMDRVPLELIAPYAAEDADMSLRLHNVLAPRLAEVGMSELAQRIEMPLVEVLATMETNGIKVDSAVLAEQKQELGQRIVELREQILAAAGCEFNIDSPRQLADVLFNKLQLPVIKKTKTGPSTDVEVLERLADHSDLTPEQARVPLLIVEYRQLTKLVNTYLDNLRDSIRRETGRIHATFHQTGAATGRLSSSGPNLQNIPIRTDVGRQIRKAFVAEPGNLLISADYSQIELRILAHLSGDAGLLAAFEQDMDIHTAVAAQVFNVAPTEVTHEQRSHAKTINFGIIYGVTPWGLARRIDGLDLDGAKKLIADYRQRFAGIDEFLAQCVDQAKQFGYVTTMFGRRRAITQINSSNPNIRALGERLAINTVVQGSAADLIKLAMVQLHQRIERENLPMKLLLQIHDELVLETPADQANDHAAIVREVMETATPLRIPLKVEAGIGPDWLAAK